MAAGPSPGGQQAPWLGQGLAIPLLAQKSRQQGGRRGSATHRRLGAPQAPRQARRIPTRPKLQVQRPPAGKTEKAHKGGAGHRSMRRFPCSSATPLAKWAEIPAPISASRHEQP